MNPFFRTQLLLALFLTLSDIVFSQDYYRVLEVEYEYGPNNKYEEEPNGTVGVEEFETNISLPLQRENGDAIVFGLGYNTVNLFPQIPENDFVCDTIVDHNYQFGRFRFQTGYSKKFNENFSIVAMGFFRVASDWVEVSSKDYLYGGLIMASKKRNENFTIKYGLYANTEHFGFLIIPLIGCDWILGEKWRIFGVLPRRISATYTINKRIRTGFVFEAPNRSYRMDPKSVYVPETGEYLDAYMQYTKNSIYALAEVYLTKSLVFRGRAGVALFREIEVYEFQEENSFNTWGVEYGAERTPIASWPAFRKFSDGLILNVSIDYRFPFD